MRITSGPAIEKPGDLAALLTNLSEGDILFVDEIHRLNRSGGGDPLPRDGGLRHRHHHRQGAVGELHPPRSAATSRSSARRRARASCPRRCATASASRCGWSCTRRRSWRKSSRASASILGIDIEPDGRAGDRARARAARRVSRTACCAACATLRRCGPTASSRRRSRDDSAHARSRSMTSAWTPYRPADAAPSSRTTAAALLGIETLAATIGEEAVTLRGRLRAVSACSSAFCSRTPRGRCVTRKAYEHLGLSVPKSMDEVPEQLSL